MLSCRSTSHCWVSRSSSGAMASISGYRRCPIARRSSGQAYYRSRHAEVLEPSRRSLNLQRSYDGLLPSPHYIRAAPSDPAVRAASPRVRSCVHRQRNKLNQIGFRVLCVLGWHWKRPAFFQKQLCKILKSACNHQTRVLKIEPLSHSSGKIECFGHDHLTGRMRQVKGNVIPKHTLMIVRGPRWRTEIGWRTAVAASVPYRSSAPVNHADRSQGTGELRRNAVVSSSTDLPLITMAGSSAMYAP
jgi:hypothetical protein